MNWNEVSVHICDGENQAKLKQATAGSEDQAGAGQEGEGGDKRNA